MFSSQSVSIVRGQAVRLREELGARHPIGIGPEHPLIHVSAGVQFVGLPAITDRFFVIVPGDGALIDRGVKRNEIELPVRWCAASRPKPKQQGGQHRSTEYSTVSRRCAGSYPMVAFEGIASKPYLSNSFWILGLIIKLTNCSAACSDSRRQVETTAWPNTTGIERPAGASSIMRT